MSGGAKPHQWRYERSFPTGVQHAFDEVLAIDLSTLFDRWYGPLPPVREVRDQEGRWGHAGQTRTLATADGGRLREELLEVDRPLRVRYRLDAIRGPLRPLVDSIDGSWEFQYAGTGVRVSWSWRVHPTGRAAGLAMPGMGRLWQGYARKGFDRIESLLVP